MSNALGLAAVTAVLKDLLNNGVIDHDLASAVGAVTVSALPPDRIQTGTDEDNRLNLFLYHVSPNVGWRNVDLPSRNGNGRRTSTPPLALDLHYLLTAYGGSELHAEILLGYGMQLLHEHPVLGRDEIRRALAAPSPVDSGALPPAFQSLSAATLAEQAEQIKIVPQSLGTEEMSKLWTALQASYRPTAAYQATVVLIESKLPARSPLPVLIRGRWSSELGREEGVRVQPSLLPPFPTLREAVPPAEQPAVRMGETLLLRGHHLEGDEVVARFTHPRSGRTFELPATANPAGTELQVDLPADPDDWRAGIHGIAAAVRTAGQPERVTNELAVAVAPRIDGVALSVSGGTATFTVSVVPPVWRTQRIALIVGEREMSAEPIPPDPALPDEQGSTRTPTFRILASELASGDQWVRLRVDGIESILVQRDTAPPRFDPSQQVTIP